MTIIPKKILELISQHPRVQDFLQNAEHVESLVKEITPHKMERLQEEYPKFFNWNESDAKNTKNKGNIYSLTLVKNDFSPNNHTRLKKIKLYIDEDRNKIVKILTN